MKGTHLGEFEELVMLVVGILYDEAYGVAVKDEINRQTERTVSLSAVHSALHRLEKKGFLISKLGKPTRERGGKRKRLFQMTSAGVAAVNTAKELRNHLWDAIPPIALEM